MAIGGISSGIRSRSRSAPNKLRPLGPMLLNGPISFASKEPAHSGNLPRGLRASQSNTAPLRQTLFRERDYLNTRISRAQGNRMTSAIRI
jgi:hypothetical protein